MNRLFAILTVGILFPHCFSAIAVAEGSEQTAGKTYVIPEPNRKIRNNCLLLNGNWQFKYDAESRWTDIRVPGEAAMQGYAIRHDQEFFYRKSFTLPSDFKGQTAILRFDGVYSHAKLYVNGKFVREHFGGFTRWETDVTDFVKPGKRNEISLTVTDRIDEISYASGYAHHPVGGILRDVKIFALPVNHISDFYVQTDLDDEYKNAVLKVFYHFNHVSNEEVEFKLIASDGKVISPVRNRFKAKEGDNQQNLSIAAPEKWDAEHPNLYTLQVLILKNGEEVSRFSKKIGFREIEIRNSQMLVNGRPVKLRGACRHDIHPVLGRTTTAELDSIDAVRIKQANMNFVRTSHYPPSENFLNCCDKYGIYVECESAVCFVNSHRQKNYQKGGASQDSVEFSHRYLSQMREMVKSFRSHASVLFWSIGNESMYGKNFQLSWDWVKSTDTTRPVIFSYPGSVGDNKPIYDILSMHYPDVHGNLNQWNRSTRGFEAGNMPVIFDEWAHPACYTYETLQTDPNIREFWGKSIDMMWSGLFEARGGLGGAIWGYVDESFMLPKPKAGTSFWKEFAHTAKPKDFMGDCVGYGHWGIVDVWRREKPEFWSTKKAYSPVRLLKLNVSSFVPGEKIYLPLYNRFDHTNISELKIRYAYDGREGDIPAPAIAPHRKGLLVVPAGNWEAGKQIEIAFYTSKGELIDRDMISIGEQPVVMPAASHGGTLTVKENADFITVCGNGFEIPFSKQSGLIENAVSNGHVVIEKGPFLNLYIRLNHLSDAELRKTASQIITDEHDWKKQNLSYSARDGFVEVYLSGYYKNIHTDIFISVSAEGKIHMNYMTSGEPNGYLRETGLAFHLPAQYDRLKWNRKGYWSSYPENSMSGNKMDVPLYHPKQALYGEKPEHPWALDAYDYYYWADAGANCDKPLTFQAKAMKENIYYYSLSAASQAGATLSICSPDASLACRLYKCDNGQLVLYVNNRWDYPEIAWGNYCKKLEATPCYGDMELIL